MTTQQKTTETPRTDAATYGKMNGVYVTPYVDAEFARQLETELTTATAAKLDAERKAAEMRALLNLVIVPNNLGYVGLNVPLAEWKERRDKALSTTLGQGWMSPEEVKGMRAKLQAWEDSAQQGHPSPCTLGSLCPYCEIDRQRYHISQLANQAAELEREVERLSKLVKDVGSRNATLERENANMLKTIADVETGIRGVVPEVDGLNVPIPIARRTYNAGCIIDTFRERCARLEGALRAHGWTSVELRRPTIEDGFFILWRFVDNSIVKHMWNLQDAQEYHKAHVTHWMKIPALAQSPEQNTEQALAGSDGGEVDPVVVARYASELGVGRVCVAYGGMSLDKFKRLWSNAFGDIPLPDCITEPGRGRSANAPSVD
jgi:hypothetical protein